MKRQPNEKKKKLVLAAQTVRALTDDLLARVQGGEPPSDDVCTRKYSGCATIP
jgi:hypothetical protein